MTIPAFRSVNKLPPGSLDYNAFLKEYITAKPDTCINILTCTTELMVFFFIQKTVLVSSLSFKPLVPLMANTSPVLLATQPTIMFSPPPSQMLPPILVLGLRSMLIPIPSQMPLTQGNPLKKQWMRMAFRKASQRI